MLNKKRGKQRFHTVATTSKGGKRDVYRALDKYIPKAEKLANEDVKDKKANRTEWDRAFLGHMDRILKKAGLRV